MFDFEILRVRIWPSTFRSQLRSKIFLLFESPYYNFLSNFYWLFLSRSVFETFDIKVFCWHFLSISYRFRNIRLQSFLGFDLWPLKVIWGQKISYHSKAHIWLPIWLLWTPSLYLVPFSRYSTSKFLGFDLDPWPLKVIWGQKISYYSKAHIWLPIWLLWTPSLYLVPFSSYSTLKVFRVWPWPLTSKGHLGSKDFIPFESPYMTSYLTSMDTISLSHTVFEIFDCKIFRVWPWPLTS